MKKITNKNKELITSSSEEMSKLIKIVIGVIALFAVFYLITILVTKKDDKKTPTPTTIQYAQVVFGDMLNQSNSEYYVMVYRQEDPYLSLYDAYLKIYKAKDKSLPYYTSNLDDGFNSQFIGEKNIDKENLKNMKLTETTLFHIKDKKIVNVYESRDAIIKLFDEITKKEDKES